MPPKRTPARAAFRSKPAAKRPAKRARVATSSSDDDDADFAPEPKAASSRSSNARTRSSRAGVFAVDGNSSGRAFGVPTPDETFVSSSNGICTRSPARHRLPSLQRCAIQALKEGLPRLYLPDTRGGGLTLHAQASLGMLPDHLKQLVWDALLETESGLIRPYTISKYFTTLPQVVLTGDLPALYNMKSLAVLSFGAHTSSLTLTGLIHVLDVTVADAVRKMPCLEHVNFRGSTNVAHKTAEVLSTLHDTLLSLNLSETSVRLPNLHQLLLRSKHLRTLKLANLKINDSMLNKLLDTLPSTGPVNPVECGSPLSALSTLKLRGNEITNSSLDRLLPLLPNLERVDVSFNPGLRVLSLLPVVIPNLSKLNVTGTALQPAALVGQLVKATSLQLTTLHLGALQQQGGWAPQDISTLAEVCLRSAATLRKIVLAGNLDLTATLLSTFANRLKVEVFSELLAVLAPFIEHLDLSLVPLKCSYFAPAFALPANAPVRELVLDETGIDDELDQALSGCTALQVLRIKNSKVSLSGLYKVIDRSPSLHTVDLTSCRGIPLRQRRRLFEAYEEERASRQVVIELD